MNNCESLKEVARLSFSLVEFGSFCLGAVLFCYLPCNPRMFFCFLKKLQVFDLVVRKSFMMDKTKF